MQKKSKWFDSAKGSRLVEIKDRSSQLANNLTPYEQIFLKIMLKCKSRYKIDFLRQYPVSINDKKYFILDFYLPALKIAFELDGEVHESQIDYDLNRDNLLMEKGIYVVRFKNNEVLKDDILSRVYKTINSRLEMLYQDIKERCKYRISILCNRAIQELHYMPIEAKEKYLNRLLNNHFKEIIKNYYIKSQFENYLVHSYVKKPNQIQG